MASTRARVWEKKDWLFIVRDKEKRQVKTWWPWNDHWPSLNCTHSARTAIFIFIFLILCSLTVPVSFLQLLFNQFSLFSICSSTSFFLFLASHFFECVIYLSDLMISINGPLNRLEHRIKRRTVCTFQRESAVAKRKKALFIHSIEAVR